MTLRAYLVPVLPLGNRRGPKYFDALVGTVPSGFDLLAWECKDYGNEPLMVVASDLSVAQDATLTANADVTAFGPMASLDTALGATLVAMQAALEALHLPAQMLTGTTTYRQVLRGVLGIFAVAAGMQARGYNIFTTGVTLSTTMGSLAFAPRQALSQCATALGYDISTVTLATTVRQVLTLIANQAPASPLGGQVI